MPYFGYKLLSKLASDISHCIVKGSTRLSRLNIALMVLQTQNVNSIVIKNKKKMFIAS